MEELRCPVCQRLIFRFILNGKMKIEAKCKRCSQMVTVVIDREIK